MTSRPRVWLSICMAAAFPRPRISALLATRYSSACSRLNRETSMSLSCIEAQVLLEPRIRRVAFRGRRYQQDRAAADLLENACCAQPVVKARKNRLIVVYILAPWRPRPHNIHAV